MTEKPTPAPGGQKTAAVSVSVHVKVLANICDTVSFPQQKRAVSYK